MKIPPFITKIRRNYAKLPKSAFNGEECVIFHVITDDNWGYGHHSFEALGVDANKNIVRASSGGCSCGGTCSLEIVTMEDAAKKMEEVGFSTFPYPEKFETHTFDNY